MHRFLLQALADVWLKEMLSDSEYVVQDEKAVRLFEEEQLLFAETVNLVVRAQELHEPLVEERVDRVAEGGLVAFGSNDEGAEIEIQHPRRNQS